MRFRRARTLLVYWKNGKLVLENYRARAAVTAEPVALRVLHLFENWHPADHLFRAMPQFSRKSLRRALRQLAGNGLLMRQGTSQARQDGLVAQTWADWKHAAWLHFGSKDVRFIQGRRKDRLLESYLRASAPPARSKSYPGTPARVLARPPAPGSEFPRVLLARETHREFSKASLPLAALSQLLSYTWGVQGQFATPLGALFHKTSPSAGARHPVEAYVLSLRVDGLPQGLYHYNCVKHRLELLRRVSAAEKAVRYCAGQAFAGKAAALCVMTAVFPRSMWKYRFSRAYRVVLLDAGHLCQTFCLTATWLGLAPFCTAALDDSLIERDLGIDGVTESALYVAGVGMPRPDRTSLRTR